VAPPVLVFMNSAPIIDNYDLSSLKFMTCAAAAFPKEAAHGARKRLASQGSNAVITNAYGLTETSPSSNVLAAKMALKKIGSIGEVLPNMEARLVGDDGNDAPIGERGELWLRGPNVMK
jgi:4-coumarate--CoA ligase